MKNTKGFTLIEGLLILVIAGVLGGTGWYVWHHHKKTTIPSSSTTSPTSASSTQSTTSATPDPTANWTLFTSQDGFSIRIPDGWQLINNNGELISPVDSSSLTYKAGTAATITKQTLGDDAVHPFVIYSPGYTDQQLKSANYQNLGQISAKNTIATKYYYEQTSQPQGLGLDKGDKEYRYHFASGQKTVDVTYVIRPGDSDNTNMVEKAVKTFSF